MLGQSHVLSNNHSMVIRNSSSTYNMQMKHKSANAGPAPSKSVLTSFRNGPVKVMTQAASSGHIGQRTAQAGAMLANHIN